MLGTLIGKIELSELERIIRGLSGADTIHIGETAVRLRTRFSYSEENDLASLYLQQEISGLGYQPRVQRFALSLDRADFEGLALSTAADTVWVGDVGGKIFRAAGSQGWERFEKCCDLGHGVLELAVDHSGRLWAACRLSGGGLGALFLSRDGGSTWVKRHSGSSVYALYTLVFSGDMFGVAAGASGTVITSGDGGASWWVVPAANFHYHTLYGSAATGPMHFWLVSSAGSVFESTDAGGTWTERSLTVYQLFDIDFSGRRGVIVGNGVAFQTADGGSSWNAVSVEPAGTQPELRCVRMVDSLRVLAGGGQGGLWLSEDGGVNWERIGSSCTGGVDVIEIVASGRDEYWLCGRDVVRYFSIVPPGQPDCRSYEIADTIVGENIRFRLVGEAEPQRTILLTAHYDSRSGATPFTCAPGADDNASGVAAVLESARSLAGASTDYTVEFVLFDGEEQGVLGSRYYARHLDPDVVYEAVVNLDMLGYDLGGDFTIEIAGRDEPVDSQLAAFIMETVDTLDLPLVPEFLTWELPASDHIAFWEHDTIPSILLIEGRLGELNPNYHTCYDDVGKIDFEYLLECSRLALAAVARLAGYRPSVPDTSALETIVLYQNSPNPFYSSTEVSFALHRRSHIELAVYDVAGRRVAQLGRGIREPDTYRVVWDARNEKGRQLSSGVYFLLLKAGEYSGTRKMILLR